MDYRKQAYYIRDVMKGNPIPLSTKKIAKIKWLHLQTTWVTDKEIEEHFKNCGGIALSTGTKISPFLCLDFDLNKALNGQYYFEAFMERIPAGFKDRLLCNTTQSGVGKHLWLRTPYITKTMHLARRLSSMDEMTEKYNLIIEAGKTPEEAMKLLLRNPYEVIIETKHRNSYAVLSHPKYKRVFGDEIQEFTEEEAKTLLEIAMTLDCGYTRPETYGGISNFYRIRNTYNEEMTADYVLDMLLKSGAFIDVGQNYNGDLQALRHGSSAGHSLTIFKDTATIHVFSPNTIFGDPGTYGPFSVLCICNGFSEAEGIDYIRKHFEIT
jgi:hypothetical protein